MPEISLEQVAKVAARLGHLDLEVYPTRSGYRCKCACGYVSTTRSSPATAAQAAAHHMQLAYRKWQASGLPLPSDTPTTTTVSFA